jgi:ankyrin repeat protein
LLNKKAKISEINSQGWNSLMFAVQNNCFDLVKIMLEGSEHESEPWKFGIKAWVGDAWVALEAITKEGWTIVHIAAVHSSPDLLDYILHVFQSRQLVKTDPDCPEVFQKLSIKPVSSIIDHPCRKQFTPFLLAVKHNRLDTLKVLVRWNCDIYFRNGKLQNALHLAASRGFAEVVDFLVRLDADKNLLRTQLDIQKRKPKDLDVFNKLEKNFLHCWDFCRLGDCERLKDCIAGGKAEVNDQTIVKKASLLHVAVENKQVQVIKVLLELGANIGVRNCLGKTPLESAFSGLDGEFITSVSTLFAKASVSKESKKRSSFAGPGKDDAQNSQISGNLGKAASLPKISKKNDLKNVEKLENRESQQFWEMISKKLVDKKVSIAFLFDMMDQGRKGALCLNEFQGMTAWLGLAFSAEVSARLFKATDQNSNGFLEYHEILKQLHRVTARPSYWNESRLMPRLNLNKTALL